jgi:hypothetical protein
MHAPLCVIHHQQNHTIGKIDPLMVAERLWRESQRLPAPPTDNRFTPRIRSF